MEDYKPEIGDEQMKLLLQWEHSWSLWKLIIGVFLNESAVARPTVNISSCFCELPWQSSKSES